jgi:hypothetical protein
MARENVADKRLLVTIILHTPFESAVNNGIVDITLGHGNAGYLVLKLEK